jgi:hypothetical protein
MKVWHLLGALVLALTLALVASCGDNVSDDDSGPKNVPFTPVPTNTPVPKLCGNGQVDAPFETCDEPDTSACTGGTVCVCCTCLSADEGVGLGDRTFTLARPASKFLSTGLAGSDVSVDPWLLGPLLLRAGRPNPNMPPDVLFPDDNCTTPAPPLSEVTEAACSASLVLAEDGLIGFNDPIQGTFCGKLFAENSVGFVDCDGGTAHAVTMSVDSMGASDEGPTTYCRNQGEVLGGPGAATLRLDKAVLIRVPLQPEGPLAAADLCPTLNYDDPFDPAQIARYNISLADILVGPVVLTTQTSEGMVLNPLGAATVLLPPVPGQNFLCPSFTETDGAGGLVGDIAGLDNPLAGGDTLNALLMFDSNP